MNNTCHCDKKAFRAEYMGKRALLAADFAEEASLKICGVLLGIDALAGAGLIAAYLSDGSEPDLSIFIATLRKKGAQFCFPRYSPGSRSYEMALAPDFDSDLKAGRYGILEPSPEMRAVPASELSRIPWLIPGVAFDPRGTRLGRGEGVYDRLLACGSGLKIGVLFETQKCAELPQEAHDCRMDWLVSEAGLQRCAQNKMEHNRT